MSPSDPDVHAAQISEDIKKVSRLARETSDNAALRRNLQNHGFIRMPAVLLSNIGLDWGGTYGDMQHFDTRNLTEGRRINSAVRRFKSDTSNHAALAAVWGPLQGTADLETEFATRYPKSFPG